MLSVIMLSVIMLSVIMPSVICRGSLCWVSLCWVSLCWVSLCWVTWRLNFYPYLFFFGLKRRKKVSRKRNWNSEWPASDSNFCFKTWKLDQIRKDWKKGSTRDWRSMAEKRGKLAAKTWPHVLWSKTIRPMDIWMNKWRVDVMVQRFFAFSWL